jgi:HK97 family phage prohead protease
MDIILCRLNGYANVFNEFSGELDGAEPLRERIRPGAFRLLHFPVTANVAHCSAPVATTWDRSLRLWQDSHGLAFELDVEATPVGAGLRDLVARGMNAMSFGLINLRSNYFRDEDGVLCREITRCDLDHVSVVHAGAFPSACCWLSDMPVDRMSPRIKNAWRRWNLGVIDRDQKRASNQAMLARLAAKAAAPAPRGPAYRPEPILIHGMDPKEYALSIGVRF